MTINIARNEELLDLAGEVGLPSLSIGLESVTQANLEHRQSFNKGRASRRPWRRSAPRASVIALMMVGLDGDDTTSFQKTLDFLVKNKLSS